MWGGLSVEVGYQADLWQFRYKVEVESLASLVRQLTAERDIHERTAWRWIARMRETGEPMPLSGRLCAYCGRALPVGSTVRRLYCPGSRCRVKAYRERQKTTPDA